jgi:hypothetical protein
MSRIWKLVGLGVLAALGFAVTAYARPTWTWPPRTTTTATTATATTTTVDETTATTTTVDVPTTTVPPAATAPGSAQMISPVEGMYYTAGSTSTFTGKIKSDAPVYCSLNWGDGSAPVGPWKATQVGKGLYQCSWTHVYRRAGIWAVTFTATTSDGLLVGTDTHDVTIL